MVTLTASEARRKAREALKGNWGKAALILLIYVAIIFVIGIFTAIPLLGLLVSIGELVIMPPITYGLTMTFMKIKRGQEVGYVDFLKEGFENFSRSWCITGRLLLKMIVPIILYLIAIILLGISIFTSAVGLVSFSSSVTGASLIFILIAVILVAIAAGFFIVLGLKYALSIYIAVDNPNMPALECVNKSGELMNGNSGKLFCLGLSFIGWVLLASILPAIFACIGIDFLYIVTIYVAEIFLLPYVDVALVVFYEHVAGVSTSQTVETEGNVSTSEASKGNTIQEKTAIARETLLNYLSLAKQNSTKVLSGDDAKIDNIFEEIIRNIFNNGNIRLDNKTIFNYTRKALRGSIGMVLQDTWLFRGTIKENLLYGDPNATDEEIENACKEAHIDHFIKTLPGGYNFMLTEDGENVSQGQRQLLTIARAIISKPKIMILDEATSSVDTRTEQQIQDALNRIMVGRTSFVIAHRLSTIKNAKLIIVMKKGHIIETGNHKELLAKNGFYAELYNSQFAGVNPMEKDSLDS